MVFLLRSLCCHQVITWMTGSICLRLVCARGGNLALLENICLGADLKGRVRFLSVALMRGSSSNRRAFPPIWDQNSSAFSRKPCGEAIMPTPSSHASGYVGTHSVSGGGMPSPPCLPAGAGTQMWGLRSLPLGLSLPAAWKGWG